MDRITEKDLEDACKRLNELTDSPVKPWEKDATGKTHGQIGNYHISHAYGGVALHRMNNTHGGIEDLCSGHQPKRELYEKINAMMKGIGIARNA